MDVVFAFRDHWPQVCHSAMRLICTVDTVDLCTTEKIRYHAQPVAIIDPDLHHALGRLAI